MWRNMTCCTYSWFTTLSTVYLLTHYCIDTITFCNTQLRFFLSLLSCCRLIWKWLVILFRLLRLYVPTNDNVLMRPPHPSFCPSSLRRHCRKTTGCFQNSESFSFRFSAKIKEPFAPKNRTMDKLCKTLRFYLNSQIRSSTPKVEGQTDTQPTMVAAPHGNAITAATSNHPLVLKVDAIWLALSSIVFG